MPEDDILHYFEPQLRSIIAGDKDGALGLNAKYTTIRDSAALESKLITLHQSNHYAEGLAALAKFIEAHKNLSPGKRQHLLMLEAQFYFADNQKKKAIAKFDEAIALDPKSEDGQAAFNVKAYIEKEMTTGNEKSAAQKDSPRKEEK